MSAMRSHLKQHSWWILHLLTRAGLVSETQSRTNDGWSMTFFLSTSTCLGKELHSYIFPRHVLF